ncbi:S8 family serine peptidase [Lewinella sp. IMCC34191]|uniref:S8 family serine peptidase n=1 Tax=Lewinella sp. IMCC34191 TaxID=2259172 RepID=UPI000E24C6A7|nr:S8 family serine peptidase [Lewinella sp. IMCC34191]
MSAINIKREGGTLELQKSRRLVGLKTKYGSTASNEAGQVMPDLGGFSVVELEGEVESGLDRLRGEDSVAVGSHVYFAAGDNRPIIPTGVIYCQLAKGVERQESDRLFERLGLEVAERRADGTVVLQVTERSRNPLHMAGVLENLHMVVEAIPDVDVPLDQYFSQPRDGLFPEQWTLQNRGSIPGVPGYETKAGADSGVQAAWRQLDGLGGADITIAVIDNGFEVEHPDLAGKIVSPLVVSSGSQGLPEGSAYGTHGTPCASLAVAPADGNGIVGAAPNARLMPLHGLTYSAFLTERMFDHCRTKGADVISCSWGTVDDRYRPGKLHERAIRRALTEGRGGKGCVVLFAAGNEGLARVNYYGQIDGVITVGASTSNDTHPGYSNRGTGLSVVAPSDGGWPVLAARCSWDPGQSDMPPEKRFYVDGRDRGPYHKHFGGTSAATPLVAGICALMLSANPDLTASAVKSILEQTADKIGNRAGYDARGWSNQFGYGRVNAERAVDEAVRRRSVPVVPADTPASPAGAYQLNVEPARKSGYGLQVGAYGDYKNVVATVAALKQSFGLPVVVEESGGLHKIVVGTFATADQARAHIEEVRAAGYRPFVRDLSTLS